MADPNAAIDRWLTSFCDALARRDIAAVTALFDPAECFWRDLVAFTWNITTQDGRAAIADMLQARLADTLPFSAKRVADAQSDGAVIEARLSIKTRLGNGDGFVRLKNGRCWTLLTSLRGLDDYPERQGFLRPNGALHGVHRGRKSWSEVKRAEEAELGVTRQPYCVIVGGGQGGIALGARLKRLGVPTLIIEKNATAGRLLAQALQVALPARSGLVRPPALPAVPRPLAGVLAEGQDRRLAGDVHQGDGAQLLGLDRVRAGRLRPEPSSEWTRRRRARRQAGDAAAQAAGAGDRHVRRAEHPEVPGPETFQGRAVPLEPASGSGDAYAGKKLRRDRLEQLRPRHLRRRCGSTTPTSPWCSARPRIVAQVGDADGAGAGAALLGGRRSRAASPPRSPI